MISVGALSKSFRSQTGEVHAIRDVSFEVAAGEIVTLLGPSGCGKTTTLRCVAGLEKPTGGRIAIGSTTMLDTKHNIIVPPHRRNLGMVFQSYAIWPHMNVIENVAYALEGRGLNKADMQAEAMRALDTVQLAHLADRPAPRLSGGQQQRVAIARALVGRPQALLFDEPLSNLDAKLRTEMRKELRRLQQQIGLTSIYVTHDQSEALAISDWIILMKDGEIVERGRPVEIYRRPKKVFTAQFLGTTNLFAGILVGRDGARGRVEGPHGIFVGMLSDPHLAIGAPVQVSVRPENIRTATTSAVAGSGANNRVGGRLELAIFGGAAVEAEVSAGESRVFCLLDYEADRTPGRDIVLTFCAEDALVLADS